ncbi:flagellar export protein FliJ [Stappia sp. F7233]|uniref:Flagellar FliJ protein n=1 Tax=Stappia albiluteola TaxID=2758565 RepID=A0A839ACK8_9HYPH|nr:flagellar export protein FliJ [Stappia albiluteola]MBA5777231.1 flagellar export protein FliJ [Stappia albiluteola]
MKSRESLIRLKKFQVDEKRRQVTQIESMIAEFERMAGELEDQIKAEQKRVGISDVTHFAYPTFAKAAAQRRDNLRNSANELAEQLDRARAELSEAVEELKKFELMEERDLLRERSELEAADQDAMDEIAGRSRAATR